MAEADIEQARSWYYQEEPGLCDRFERALERALQHITANPGRHPLVMRGLRKAPVESFPYRVFYVEELDGIRVHAVLHERRDPAIWRSRP